MARERAWPTGTRPGLDGVRGLAILLVLVGHLGILPRVSAAGPAGVTVFFVLSGFLITRVLLTRERTLWAFYTARAVRLVPALLLTVTVAGLLWAVSGRGLAAFWPQAATALLYVEDFVVPPVGGDVLSHTWSLAVEEQFYLLWPMVLPLVLRLPHRRRLIVLVGAAVLSVLTRFGLLELGYPALSFSSFPSNAFALLAGCALAVLPPPRISARAAVGLGGTLLVLTLVPALAPPRPPLVVPVFVTAAAVLLLAGAAQRSPVFELPPLRFAGRVSYSWYLWHWPLLWLSGSVHDPVKALPWVATSFALACLSTLLMEEPLRRYWRSRSDRAPDGPRPELEGLGGLGDESLRRS